MPTILTWLLLTIGPAFASGTTAAEVGIAAIDITPAIGVPLGGYGGGARRLVPYDNKHKYPYCTFLAPSTGVRDPIRSKAMVIRKDGKKLAFISLDVIGV